MVRMLCVNDSDHMQYTPAWPVGSAFVMSIIKNGFDERHAYIGGMFGAGTRPGSIS